MDNKAENIVVLDMRKVVNFCDYFIIASASSDRRLRGVAENISEELTKVGINVYHLQGLEDSTWVVMDFGDVVVHLFDEATREFYGLEHLWQESKRVNWDK